METWDLTTLDVRPHQPVVLQSDEGAARVVALALPAGEELQDHEVHEHAWLHVHRGAVEVVARADEQRRVGAGGLVHWRPGERHAVRAVEDALLVLLLAPWPGPGHPSLRGADPGIPVGQAEPEAVRRPPGAPATTPLDPPSAG